MYRTIFSLVAMILFAVQLQAVEIRWARGTADGNFVGNYSNGDNWDGGIVPGPADRARVDRGSTEMTLDSTIVANDFLFGVDEEPQNFLFTPTADVTLASNFFLSLNRGGATADIQAGASVNVGGNFLLGQQTSCCGGVPVLGEITVTLAGDVDVSGTTILGDQYDGEPIITDVLLDVLPFGTLITNNISFAPNGDLAAYLAAGNTMRVRVADDALITFRGDHEATVQDQIDSGLYFTDSTEGMLLASYDMASDSTLIRVATSTDCDFNSDGACNGVDVDMLVGEIVAGTNNADFDLTGDGQVTRADLNDPVDGWLIQAGEQNIGPGRPYIEGDANLDATVDGGDFLDWNTNKFNDVAEWTAGDFNADGTVDGGDFLIWNTNKFTSSDLASVPEPNSAMLLLVTSLFGIFVKGRRASFC